MAGLFNHAPIVIAAHGPGSRLAEVTHGESKACVTVGDRTILERQLESARLAGRDVIVYTSPHDTSVPRLLAGLDVSVEVRRRAPEGGLVDLIAIADEVGCPFTAVDCDLVVEVGRLAAFMSPPAADPGAWEACVAVTKDAKGLGPRTVWASLNGSDEPLRRVRALARDERPTGTRLAGAYHWSSGALRRLAAAHADGTTSLAAALAVAVREGAAVAAMDVGDTFNVNTPADLAHAARSLHLV